MAYFEAVLAETSDRVWRSNIATLALDAALNLERFSAAIQLSLMMLESFDPGASAENALSDSRYVEWQVGRVLRLTVASDTETPEWLFEVTKAKAHADTYTGNENHWVKLVKSVVDGFVSILKDGDSANLNAAFEVAVSCNAKRIAQTLAWFWVFRFAPGRQRQERDFVLWEWRLCWLTLEIGQGDMSFLGQFLTQQRDFWGKLGSGETATGACHVLRGIRLQSAEYQVIVTNLHNYLAKEAVRALGMRNWISEICRRLAAIEDRAVLSRLRELTMEVIGDALFSPNAIDLTDLLQECLNQLHAAITTRLGPRNLVLDEWLKNVDDYLSVAQIVATSDIETPITHVLLRLASFVPTFKPSSAAHYYVLLRHSAGNIDVNMATLSSILDIVTSKHALTTLENEDLSVIQRIRLGTVVFFGRGSRGTSQLGESLANLMVQQGMTGPVFPPDFREGETSKEYSKTLANLKECILGLDRLEDLCRMHNITGKELACIRLERGGLRKFVGMVLFKSQESESAWREWLGPALTDFRAVVDERNADGDKEATGMRLIAASEGVTAAECLGLSDQLEYLRQFLDRHSGSPEFAQKITELAAARDGDPLRKPLKGAEDSFELDENDVETIRKYAEHVMRAHGIPVDRRKHVEDDIRKLAKFETERKRYCKHLQPVQENVERAFSRPTEYTCSCSLLGYKTGIAVDEIEIALLSMKLSYCDSCDKRMPLAKDG
jgi:hypothetical protein